MPFRTERTESQCSTQTSEYYSALKRKEPLSQADTEDAQRHVPK